MRKRLLLLSSLLLTFGFAFSQFTTVGIIGTATPGGWDNDTDMVKSDTNDNVWILDIALLDGEAKFRAEDDWADNWGDIAFPSGIGVNGGGNVPVVAGDYTVIFNSETGAYYFDIDSDIGLIGDASPGGWDNDTDLYKDQTDPNKFFLTVDLSVGSCKFRKDDDWAVNWGAADFPTGTGTQDGDNVPIDKAGTYYITFDTSTGVYLFEEIVAYESIGLIGDATPTGWDNDTNLVQSATDPDVWTMTVELTDGEAKFRANDDWAISWGATDFPEGIGTIPGDNIPVVAGKYYITFNTGTGAYKFAIIEAFTTIGLIGDATPGGWDNDTDLEQDANDESIWTGKMELTDGEGKFRANDDWVTNWGSGDFPIGVGTQDGANIPVTAGEYLITFNSTTGAYEFKEVVEFDAVSIVGKSGPFGEWPGDDDSKDAYLTVNPDNAQEWTGSAITLTDYTGESDSGIKFRAEAAWDVNWGAADFPSGIGVQEGDNIECTAGSWDVLFNSETGEYVFLEHSSTSNIALAKSIKLYPNPAENFVTIDLGAVEFKGNFSVKVMNIAGQTVLDQVSNSSSIITIPVTGLQAGTYFVQLSNEKFVVGKKFSIAK